MASWDRFVPSPVQFHFEFAQLAPHPVASGLPPELEVSLVRASADMREAQEVERLRFAKAAPLSVCRREATKLNQARLVRMQRQRKLSHQLRQEPLGISLVLEADDGTAHQDDLPKGMAFAPLLRPKIEDVMQVDGRKY